MNELGKEQSPYLLQHKDNPVHWKAWSDQTLQLARQQNKPIFLSIGYSTCHWCHVMEHESFENPEVANLLNQEFISIKVDREERPEIDDIYMKCVQAITGHGGWPMSVFLTPDLSPFFGGTYFPQAHFMKLLSEISRIWASSPEKIQGDADQIHEALRKMTLVEPSAMSEEIRREIVTQFLEQHRSSFDSDHGGFGGAPKFPQTMNLMSLLRSGSRESDFDSVDQTLLAMARGGMHDHLRGGFHRYSVDRYWLVSHFEKMLYDQAWLLHAFTEGYQKFHKEEYRQVAEDLVGYVERELRSAEGGFFSAQDADSLSKEDNKKHEGYFCTYTDQELQSTLSEDEIRWLKTNYNVQESPVFEGRHVLFMQPSQDWEKVYASPQRESIFKKLEVLRAGKEDPHLDDKVIAAWNGWMIAALAKFAPLQPSGKAAELAKQAYHFCMSTLYKDDVLYRTWRNGELGPRAVSDDYVALIYAGLQLFAMTSDPSYLAQAEKLQAQLDQLFWDDKDGGYFRDDGQDASLILRVKEDYDGVRPNSNSLALWNLHRLHRWTGESAYQLKHQQILELLSSRLSRFPTSMPFAVCALLDEEKDGKDIVSEALTQDDRDLFYSQFRPADHLFLSSKDSKLSLFQGKSEGYYACRAGRCEAPVQSLKEALE